MSVSIYSVVMYYEDFACCEVLLFFLFIELTHGWWNITSTGVIDRLLRTLCIRGFREKGLYKALQKNKEFIASSVNPANLNECERLFKELLVAHQNNKVLPSITSSNSSSSSSSDSDSDDDSSGEGVKSEESGEDEVKMETSDKDEGGRDETSASESMDIADNQKPNETELPSSSEEKPFNEVPSGNTDNSNLQREETTDSGTETKPRASEIPPSGVYDPTYPSMTLHVAVKVMEYLEAMQQRLFTANLNVEVGVFDCV